MVEKVDLRGLSCPEPVIRTKKLFDNKEISAVEALVDDDVCASNLERFARSIKAAYSSNKQHNHYIVSITRDGEHTHAAAATAPGSTVAATQGVQTVVFITKDQLGSGDEDFGRTLLNVFLQTLFESAHRPRAILMANTGVKLMKSDSQVLKVLNDFKDAGTDVLACGLCVKFYNLEADIPKEQITSMFAICEYLISADKVLTP